MTQCRLLTGKDLPDFNMPSERAIKRLLVGDTVRLVVSHPNSNFIEAVTVLVVEADYPRYAGMLGGTSIAVPELKAGDDIKFHSGHIFEIWSSAGDIDNATWWKQATEEVKTRN